MRSLFWGLIVLAVVIVFGLFALDSLTRSRAELEYQRAAGRAVVIEAQGQARLDSAQAAAITSAAMLPWLIVFVLSILATVAIVYLLRQPASAGRPAPPVPPVIVERQVIFLPPPGEYSRRELLQVISEAREQ